MTVDNTMYNKKISEILNRYRKEEGLSLYKAAQVLDVTPQRVQQYETGGTIPGYRIRYWAIDPVKPKWVRRMASEMLRNVQLT
jgi:DNA-binding XRE family transcriptional regulator